MYMLDKTGSKRTVRKPTMGGALIAAGLVVAGLFQPLVAAAAPSDQSCFSLAMRYEPSCGSTEVDVSVSPIEGGVRVAVTTTKASGSGAPLAVELPVLGVSLTDSAKQMPDFGAGFAELATVAKQPVVRCAFDRPQVEAKAGEKFECDLPLLGMDTGSHTMWITGFFGAVPKPNAVLGTIPAALGVVSSATPRSIEFTLSAGKPTVAAPSQTNTNNPPTQVVVGASGASGATAGTSSDGDSSADSGSKAVPVIAGIAGALAAAAVVISRRKRGELLGSPPES